MPRLIQKGSTDISLYFLIVDSADGSPETGVTITDLDLQYVRFGAAPVAKVDATALAATNSVHADNKAIEIDGTDQPGLYRVDWPDAAFATGVDGVVLTVKGTGFHPAHMEIQLVDFDPTDAVRLGLTALPNAIPGAAGGLLKTDLGRDYDTDLKSAAFSGGMVWVDSAGTASTAWPYGTAPFPTDTIARGKTIADANGLTQLRVKGNHTLVAAMEAYNFVGGLYLDAAEIITLGGFSVEHSSFRDLVIAGVCGNAALIGDQTTYTNCYLYGVTNIHGWVNHGRIESACSIRDTGYATLRNVLFGSGVACTLTLQAPTQCDIENMSGELTLSGMDGGVCSISMARGSLLTIDNTCTAGTITITGAGIVTDNSNGSTVTVKVNEADITQISGDSTAADNLELQYDTTGLAGDTFPATQSQLAGIANVGSAVHTPADSYTLTTGTQSSGTVASTQALDGTNHEHTDDAGVMDLYYEFLVGSGVPSSVTVTGYLNGNNDNLEVYGYDWVATAWVRIGTLAGKAASTNEVQSYDMFVNMVGSGGDEGKVRVRFTDGAFTLTGATLAIDQVFASFSRGVEGYDNGAIWIDTTVSNTNTVVGIDGTARNPVSTIAAANTLSVSTNLNRFEVAPGSSITFAASQDNQVFNGMNWTLALGGQSVSGSHITGASVSGICTGVVAPSFTNCYFGATTVPPCRIDYSSFLGTLTAGSAGDFFLDRCHSGVAGTSSPIFDFGAGLAASNLNMRGYSGGIEIQNMGAGVGTYNMSLEGDGALVINANCSATSNIALRGNFILTDNAGGAVTVTTDDDTTDINAILVDTNEMQGKLPTNNIMGSSVASDKDDEIDAIKAVTDLLPDAGALNDLATLVGRLTAARAGYLDELAAANIPADIDTLLARLTAARAGYLDELAAANLPADIDTLLARLTAARAGYLDELAAANLPADVDTLLSRITAAVALASVCTEARLAELGAANIPADIDTLLARLTALRAGYLDNLNGHTPQTGDSFARIGAAGAGLTGLGGMSAGMKTEVNDEVLDVLNVDTFAQPGQEAPAATTTLVKMLSYWYKHWRNKSDDDGSFIQHYADDAATVDHKRTVSDDGATYTHGEVVSGP